MKKECELKTFGLYLQIKNIVCFYSVIMHMRSRPISLLLSVPLSSKIKRS